MSFSEYKAPPFAVSSYDGVQLGMKVDSIRLAPGGILQGEVNVVVPPTAVEGVPYYALRLSLIGKESNTVVDDQAEYEPLLEGYTADRVYLSRNVTLAGNRRALLERKEVEQQAKQEMLFVEHHATPYTRVIQPPSIEEELAGMYKGLEDYESGEDSAENIVNHPDGTFSSVQISRPTRRQARVLLPGKYRFPFGFRLPPWLPPSYYYSTFMAKGKNQYTAKAVLMIMKHYDNYTDEKDPDLYNNKVKKELTTKLNFFVLTAMSKRQLLRAYREASKTLSRVPNCLSARYQVFRCGFFGNMCCFLPNGGIEVEVEVLGSKALIMKRDAHAEDLICQEQKKLRESKDDTGEEKETTEWVFPPFPAEQLPIKIYVRNELSSKSIPAVKVELVEMIDVFKPLEASHTLHPPLAKVQYKKKIAPGQSMEWETNLILPKYFRRCKGDGGSYLPPPGIQTANIRTYVSLVIKFPGLNTYIEEQDWDSHVLNIAELLDTDNQVLNLPVKYS